MRDLRRRHPDAHVRTRHLDSDEARALPGRQVDALVTRTPLPIPDDGLEVTVLYDEPRCAPRPRLPPPRRQGVRQPGRLRPRAPSSPAPAWRRPGPGSGGSPPARTELRPRSGPMLADTFEDKLEVVADGRAVAIVPAGDRRSTLRDDLVTIPVDGIEPCQVAVVTRAGDRNPLVARFRESARNCLAR
ncbi:hypothetical protein GCM10020220_039070 [Nonomuraea rubra]|uniref:LysR substrate-binding domain-containing protein n=1 Tax=Nonomuraea rubra TaxID=46180 RepID=UPI0031EF2168